MNKICLRYMLALLLAGTLQTAFASQEQEESPESSRPAFELSLTHLGSYGRSMLGFFRAHPKLTGITCCTALIACPPTRNLIIKLVAKPFELYRNRQIRSIEAETARLQQEAQTLQRDLDAEHERQATFLAPQLESIRVHTDQIEANQWTPQDTIRMAQTHGKFDQAAQQATSTLSSNIQVYNRFVEQTNGVAQDLQRIQFTSMQPGTHMGALEGSLRETKFARSLVQSIAENQHRIIQTLTQQ